MRDVGHPASIAFPYFEFMIDSHAHLDSPRYDEDRDALLTRAFEAWVTTVLSIGIGDGPETMV